jgi:hypothetical protein
VDIHKPRPVHGWKELLSEIGVVVIGISIALTAEAGIEAWHWREQVKGANEALTSDVGRLIGYAAEREAFSACVGQHLDRWTEVIEDGVRMGRFPAQGAMHRAPPRLWRLNSWDGLIAAGIGPHLPRDELVILSLLSYDLTLAGDLQADENVQWTRLYTLVGPGRPVEAGEMVGLRDALSRATGDAKTLRATARDIAALIEASKLLPKDREKKIRDSKIAFAKASCRPDEPVAAHYGDGPPAGEPLDRPLRQ